MLLVSVLVLVPSSVPGASSDDRRQVHVFLDTLEQLLRRVKNFNKKQKGSDEERAKQFAQQAIEQLKAKPARYFVARVQVDGNDKALPRLSIKRTKKKASVFVLHFNNFVLICCRRHCATHWTQ
jgi:hypothetical protein